MLNTLLAVLRSTGRQQRRTQLQMHKYAKFATRCRVFVPPLALTQVCCKHYSLCWRIMRESGKLIAPHLNGRTEGFRCRLTGQCILLGNSGPRLCHCMVCTRNGGGCCALARVYCDLIQLCCERVCLCPGSSNNPNDHGYAGFRFHIKRSLRRMNIPKDASSSELYGNVSVLFLCELFYVMCYVRTTNLANYTSSRNTVM